MYLGTITIKTLRLRFNKPNTGTFSLAAITKIILLILDSSFSYYLRGEGAISVGRLKEFVNII